MAVETAVYEKEDQRERFYSAMSFWISVVLSAAFAVWYYTANPPDDSATRRLRMFFKKNIMEVTKFIALPPEEQKAFAQARKHPFYISYYDASVIEKDKIKALIHMSYDYTPYQYWFNIVFLWVICFTTLWFLGKMTEAVLVVQRNKPANNDKS
ncbi:MAG: hypothetical protein HZA02_08330 [Nitrospinae bacterium]|nr:hypothetical protein [Nitrospinota bacterium]